MVNFMSMRDLFARFFLQDSPLHSGIIIRGEAGCYFFWEGMIRKSDIDWKLLVLGQGAIGLGGVGMAFLVPPPPPPFPLDPPLQST